MRTVLAMGLSALSIVSLVACNRSGSTAGDSSSAAANAVQPASGPLRADHIPHRKPGLWKQTIAMDGAPAGPGFTELCVDADSEAKMSLAAQNIPGAHCDTPRFTKNLDGTLTFTGGCDMGANGKVQTTGTLKGDFNSAYTATIASTTSGSPVAAMNGAHTMVITAVWTGPCAPGQVGGDMILANGMRINPMRSAAATPSAGN
ncbi:MAG TPA: DUF3617 family protein [Caulobacteraceae bacterium]|nr:DUF3617 family protein [Caulobacteraceae bacterium]